MTINHFRTDNNYSIILLWLMQDDFTFQAKPLIKKVLRFYTTTILCQT